MILKSIPLLWLVAAWTPAAGAPAAPADDGQRWPGDDAEERATAVNEGELVFLETPPAEPVHHHRNTITIRPATLGDGWARLIQCHENLDPVPRAQVVFNEGRVRNLAIRSYRHIGRAWVEGPSVQIEGVERGAVLCLEAESRVLHRNEDGTYTVRNGPFMRRFLDGYYPMRVSMSVRLPDGLRFLDIIPPAQKGFRVWHTSNAVHFDAWFEGRLYTEIRLAPDT